MKRFSQRAGYATMAELNVTPLLDLAFVLLIIFIITTPLLEQGIQVNLPTAPRSSVEVNPKSVRTIAMDRSGVVYFDKTRLNLRELQSALASWKRSDPEASAVLRFDRDLRLQQVVEIFDALERAGISRTAILNTPEHGQRGR
jgi:biopolymer transport protein ExbD